MDKEKDTNHAGNLLLPPGRYSVYSPPSSSYGLRSETLGSTIFPPLGSGGDPESGYYGHGLPSDSRQFSHDISRMPDNPPKNMGHRRAHSEILMLPDDISFDSDLGVVGGLNGTSFSDDTEEDLLSMYFDVDKFSSSSATSAFQVGEPYSSAARVSCSPPKPLSSSVVGAGDSLSGVSEKPRIRHQHSLSMDGSTSIKTEMLTSGTEEASSAEAKKAMSSAKLAELALIDPKRAKRILANRQSAARSKERKMRYIAELERKVQTLQTEATTLSAQLTLMQRDTNGLTAENSELKLRMQTMEQQVRLQDALNDALKEEIQHLKVLSGQIPNGGPYFSPSLNPHYYSGNPMMHTMMTTQQFQQLQINSQKNQQQQFHQNQLHQLQQQQHSQSVVLSQGDIKSRGVSLQSHVVNDGPDMAPSSTKG